MVKKSLKEMEKDLYDSITLLKDSIEKIDKKDFNYLKVISSQLRALVCMGSKSLNPLLFNLAEEKSLILECYAFSYQEDLEQNPSLVNDATFLLIPTPVISFKPIDKPTFKKKNFKKWLMEPILKIGKNLYTANDIIRTVAEKEGGAHYDRKLSEKLIKAKKIIFRSKDLTFNQAHAILISVTLYVIKIGECILDI